MRVVLVKKNGTSAATVTVNIAGEAGSPGIRVAGDMCCQGRACVHQIQAAGQLCVYFKVPGCCYCQLLQGITAPGPSAC